MPSAPPVDQNRVRSAQPGAGAQLTVLVVSAGPAEAGRRAATAVLGACPGSAAQVILVSQAEPDPSLLAFLKRNGARYVRAPMGCTRAEMCDLGMKQTRGGIIAVRQDVEVGDARWLSAFRSVIPALAHDAPRLTDGPRPSAETVTMDTMDLGVSSNRDSLVAPLADVVGSAARVEMAAIM